MKLGILLFLSVLGSAPAFAKPVSITASPSALEIAGNLEIQEIKSSAFSLVCFANTGSILYPSNTYSKNLPVANQVEALSASAGGLRITVLESATLENPFYKSATDTKKYWGQACYVLWEATLVLKDSPNEMKIRMYTAEKAKSHDGSSEFAKMLRGASLRFVKSDGKYRPYCQDKVMLVSKKGESKQVGTNTTYDCP